MPLQLGLDKNLKVITTIPGWAEDYNESQKTMGGSAVAGYKSSAWAYRAISIRADAIASAPLELYDGDGNEIEEHPVLELLKRVNSEWNQGDLWRYTESAFCVYGAAYWQKVRAGNRITELYFMNPGKVEVVMDSGGVSGFKQTKENGKTFDRQDVVYFRGSYDPTSDLTGIAPMQMATLAALGELKADQYMAAFFGNYAVPPLLLTTDQQISESLIEKIQAWWNRMFKGASNQFKAGIVGSGLKPVQLSSTIADLALDTTRAEMHRTICVALGVDELLLSSTGAADRTPVDAALYHLYTTTIIPRWKYYEEVLNAELITEYPDLVEMDAYFEFDQGDVKPLQDDQNEYAQTLATLVGAKIIKPETAAEELGFEDDDVPEAPEPPPPPVIVNNTLPPADNNPPTPPENAVGEGDTEEINATLSIELDKWRRKAIKALKAGNTPEVEFISEYIDQPLYKRIKVGLSCSASIDEVNRVFQSAKSRKADYNGYSQLAQAINRATALLEKYSDVQ